MLTKIPKFRRCVIQSFPFIEEDFDALTDYELLCKVVEYLNKVITSQNEVVEATEGLLDAFSALQSYVDSYFDNLDVQEEINNKLDAMVEDGTLQEIITEYIQANTAWCFDTVSDMQASTNLISGSYAQTLGHDSINDGGGALYKIEAYNAGKYQESIDGTLYASLIGPLTPENTGLDVDNLINNYNNFTLEFLPNKVYEVNSPITIRDVKYYDFHGSTLKYVGDSTVEDFINVGYNFNNNTIRMYAGIKNVNIDGNDKVDNCLHIVGGKGLLFENIKIMKPLEYGLLADNTVGQLWELTLNNIQSDAKNTTSQGISAIKLTGITDSFFTNLYPINGSSSWMYASTASSKFNRVHGYRYPDDSTTAQTQGFDLYGNGNTYTSIIVDTADSIGIKVHGNYNHFDDISLGVKASGKGIVDSDYNSYDHIYVAKALASIIEKATGGNFLEVRNLMVIEDSGVLPTKDINFVNNTLPYHFHYDNSGRAASGGSIQSKFRFLNQWIYYANTSASHNLTVAPTNANYEVAVLIRNKPVPYQITRTTSAVTITFNGADIPDGSPINYDIVVKPYQ